MLKKTYSPLSKFKSWAFIIISRTESADAHSTTTAKDKEQALTDKRQWIQYDVCRQNIVTVQPAKSDSDSDVMFCLQYYQGLLIDRSLEY